MHVVGPASEELATVVGSWSRRQRQLVVLAAAFDESGEWAMAGYPSAAHWLAEAADVAVCTARTWVRIGHRLQELPKVSEAFAAGDVSYAKVRTLSRVITTENEDELLEIARAVPAGHLAQAVAAHLERTLEPDELARHQHEQRSVRWRHQADGMVTFTLHLPPLVAGVLIAWLTTWVSSRRSLLSTANGGEDAPAGTVRPPSVAQQHADAVEALVGEDLGGPSTEVVIHVRGDGCTLDDGTPITESAVARLLPESLVSVLIHDAERHPIDASNRRRFPTRRQRRLVKERDRVCVDCGREDLLEFDHDPPYEETGHTVTDELHLRCAPCHRTRHEDGAA